MLMPGRIVLQMLCHTRLLTGRIVLQMLCHTILFTALYFLVVFIRSLNARIESRAGSGREMETISPFLSQTPLVAYPLFSIVPTDRELGTGKNKRERAVNLSKASGLRSRDSIAL